MMVDLLAVAGEIPAPLVLSLTNDDGEPIDLTDAVSYTLHLVKPYAATRKIDTSSHLATYGAAEEGRVAYTWQATDLDTAGRYHLTLKITFIDTHTEVYPKPGPYIVEVLPEE